MSQLNKIPFELPAHYKVDLELSDSLRNRVLRDQDLIHKRMKAFRYANEKFAQFVAFIKESDLKDKSVVAMTGDHNFWGSINYTREETFQKYLTPFYIYSPLELRPMIVNPNVLGSHLDIMPTLYHLTLSNMTYYSLGKNLMTTNLPLAWNSRILANETGIKEEEDYYLWNDINSRTTQLEKLNDLDIAYKAYLSITDYYFKFKVKKP